MAKMVIRGGPDAHSIRVAVGGRRLDGVSRIVIDPIEPGGIATATITVSVKLDLAVEVEK